jgi:hypothetical protein
MNIPFGITFSIPFSITSVIQTTTVAIGAVSLVLNYISHRDSVFDSQYERESKIDDKMDRLPLSFGDLSAEKYVCHLNYIKSTVYETEPPFAGWGFLLPRAEIDGQTKLSFSIVKSREENITELGEGKYVADIESSNTSLTTVGVNIESDTGGMVHVMIDSVDVDEVGRSVSTMGTAEFSLEENENRFDEVFDSAG